MPRKRPPFDMQRACFLLIAVLVCGAVSVFLITALGCVTLIFTGRMEIGGCINAGVTGQIREIFSEILTAILALLLGARGGPPPPPGAPRE